MGTENFNICDVICECGIKWEAINAILRTAVENQIINPKELFKLAEKYIKSINMLYVSKEDIIDWSWKNLKSLFKLIVLFLIEIL